jgi:hypothetical protein
MQSSLERGDQLRMRFALAFVRFRTLPSSGAMSQRSGINLARKRTSQSGILAGRYATGDGAETFLKNHRHIDKLDDISGDGKEAFAFCGGAAHCAKMEVGYVSDVYSTEGNMRTDGDGSIEESPHYFDGGSIVTPEGRTEDSDRVDDGELKAIALACDKFQAACSARVLDLA